MTTIYNGLAMVIGIALLYRERAGVHPRQLLRIALVACGVACSDVVTLPIQDQVPVVHGMLVSGETTHEFVIEQSTPYGLPVSTTPIPFSSEKVTLSVVAPDGAIWPLESRPTSSVEFLASGVAIPRATYVVSGRIDNSDVRASVTLPSQLEITDPVADTVIVAHGDTVRLTFTAAGAFGVLVSRTVSRDGPAPGFGNVLTRQGVFELLTADGSAFAEGDTVHIGLLALDSVSTRYVEARMRGSVDPIVLPSNVEGAVGLVSGATAAELVVVIR